MLNMVDFGRVGLGFEMGEINFGGEELGSRQNFNAYITIRED